MSEEQSNIGEKEASFGQFVFNVATGLVGGVKTDAVALIYATGLGLTLVKSDAAQKVGKGLIGYATLMQLGNFTGALAKQIQFHALVVRDNPFFTEKGVALAQQAAEETQALEVARQTNREVQLDRLQKARANGEFFVGYEPEDDPE